MTRFNVISIAAAAATAALIGANPPTYAAAAQARVLTLAQASPAGIDLVRDRRGGWRGGLRGHRRGIGPRVGGWYSGPGYGYYGYRRGWRGDNWWGPAIGAGVAGLIIGGSIAASRSGYSDRWQQCDDEYVSFRWSDGTFQPYGGGPRQLCPYLRG